MAQNLSQRRGLAIKIGVMRKLHAGKVPAGAEKKELFGEGGKQRKKKRNASQDRGFLQASHRTSR